MFWSTTTNQGTDFMKTLIATLLATAAGSSFAFAPTAALNHDPATYRALSQKAAAEYKTATAKCTSMSGNDKDVCMAEAKATRAHTEADALAKYAHTDESRAKAREKVAQADYDVAKAKCGAMSGADKDGCMNNAKSVHTAALADAKSATASTVATTGSSGVGGSVGASSDKVAAQAADKCAQAGGDGRTGCLVETRKSIATTQGAEAVNRTENATANAADKTRAATATAAEKTRAVAANVGEKTKELAQATVEKTKEVAHTVAQKTETTMDRAGEKSREVASTAAQKTHNTMEKAGEKTREAGATVAHKTENAMETAGEKTRDTASTVAAKADDATDTAAANSRHAAAKTSVAAADTAITTKVKANLLAEPALKSLGIHVETEKGTVMLSGFVDSKAEADKAIKVAKEVEGVSKVKSAIKVK
jgi:osmotically-inducible protein OsmY